MVGGEGVLTSSGRRRGRGGRGFVLYGGGGRGRRVKLGGGGGEAVAGRRWERRGREGGDLAICG
jgi:hypothetical protein